MKPWGKTQNRRRLPLWNEYLENIKNKKRAYLQYAQRKKK